MSDLHCPARLLVARHAQAEYETGTFSDADDSLTLDGRGHAGAMAARLRDRNIALIYCSDVVCAVQTAEIAAATLGVAVRVRPGLRDLPVGDVDVADPNEGQAARLSAELSSIADQHRGEAVLVVGHSIALCATLPRLALNVADDFGLTHPLGSCELVELAADADGWRVESWSGDRLEAGSPR
jgi:probable phosphoglycerate mutase